MDGSRSSWLFLTHSLVSHANQPDTWDFQKSASGCLCHTSATCCSGFRCVVVCLFCWRTNQPTNQPTSVCGCLRRTLVALCDRMCVCVCVSCMRAGIRAPCRLQHHPNACTTQQWWLRHHRATKSNQTKPHLTQRTAPHRTVPYRTTNTHQGEFDDREIRVNFPSYIQLDSETWVQGIVLPGEGIYGCANRGTCISPDTCSCADGYVRVCGV